MPKFTTADRLKYLMSERNLKQIDIVNMAKPFADKYMVKIGRNDISQYVSGKVEPRQSKLFILAKALRVSEAWLMGYDVDMLPAEETDNCKKDLSQMTAREILDYAEEMDETTYDILGYDGKNRTRTKLTKEEYEKVMGIIEILRKDIH